MALDPNSLIYISYPRVNCLKTIPFTEAHIYIAHIWQNTPRLFAREELNQDYLFTITTMFSLSRLFCVFVWFICLVKRLQAFVCTIEYNGLSD